jgi:hypothetical protein
MPRDGGTPTIAFGRCGDERVLEVSLLLTSPPPGGTPILWKIRSPGSTRTSFTLGSTPQGFDSIVPLTGDLPAQQLVVEIRTDDARWPSTTTFFLADQLRPTRMSSSFGDVKPERVGELSRQGCVPRPGYWS